MTSLVLGHFVNGVVNSVETGSLGVLGNAELVLAGASLGSSALLEIGLRVIFLKGFNGSLSAKQSGQ